MASAAGLMLLTEQERSAANSTTYGVGELIKDALERGYRDILLTLGGSATNDGGCGMFAALGARFYNEKGGAFIPTGGTLLEIDRLDVSAVDERLKECHITVATDVTNPLLGAEGATNVYGAQKGATEEELAHIEQGMAKWSQILFTQTGKAVQNIKGCGAAGGLSAPLLAFYACQVKSGIEAVLEALNYEEKVQHADIVITGEGKLDKQSLYGKAISGVAKVAVTACFRVYVRAIP